MPQPTPHAFVHANGIELCYDTFGDPDAPTLLLIMGLATQMIAWEDDFCAELAGRGLHVVRFDNRDVGQSTWLHHAGLPDVGAAFMAAMQGRPPAAEAPYTLSDMAQDAVGLLDALGIESAHVVGASMGGAIAQTLAIEHPQRLRTMTSIMATTGAPDLPPPTPQAAALLFRPAPADQAAYFASYQQTMNVLRAGEFALDAARDLQRASRNFARGLNPPGAARQLMAILASGSRREALRKVDVPTLVIHGDADPLVPLACGIDTAQAVPGARMLVVEGMGHALPISMWPQIVEAIAAHVARPGA
jgi:pimeloyl-ACP methyl ester carboxylesterase